MRYSDPRMKLGANVLICRRQRGLTIQQLGRAIKKHRHWVTALERGNVDFPSDQLLSEIAKALKVSRDELLEGIEKNKAA